MLLAFSWMALMAVTWPAVAAEPAPSASAKYRRVAQECATEASNFCTRNEQSAQLGREQTDCLKQHRPDLSLPCRGAVNAALQ